MVAGDRGRPCYPSLPMRFELCAALAGVLATSSLAVVACDPDLTVDKRPGATDAGADAAPTSGGTDAGGPIVTDGGSTDDAAVDAGPTGHKIDGTNDFLPGEKFQTSSSANGYDAYFAFDAKNLYFGMNGADIGAGASDTKWILVYIEGTTGTTTGIDYGGKQQPTLPFSAGYHLRIKTDLTFRNGQKWNGAAWVDASLDGLVPDTEKKGEFVEFSITRAAIGNPSKVKVHMNMIIEQNNADWSYAAMPKESFTDGKDPDYAKYFDFDLTNTSKAPNTYAPLP